MLRSSQHNHLCSLHQTYILLLALLSVLLTFFIPYLLPVYVKVLWVRVSRRVRVHWLTLALFCFGFLSQDFRGSHTWIDDTRLFFNRQSPHAQLSRRSNQTNSLIHYFTISSSGHQKSDFHFLFTYYASINICTYCYRNIVPLPTVT